MNDYRWCSSQPQVLEIHSFLRSYHAYMEIWTPVVGEMLVVKREPTNRHDIHVVANLAPRLSAILMRQQNVFRNHWSKSQQGSWLWSGSPMCLPFSK